MGHTNLHARLPPADEPQLYLDGANLCFVSAQLPFHAGDAMFFHLMGQFVVHPSAGQSRSELFLTQVSFVCGLLGWVAQLSMYPVPLACPGQRSVGCLVLLLRPFEKVVTYSSL